MHLIYFYIQTQVTPCNASNAVLGAFSPVHPPSLCIVRDCNGQWNHRRLVYILWVVPYSTSIKVADWATDVLYDCMHYA